jgi:DNA-binding response OmpR family regulator
VKVLVVDDDAELAGLVQFALRQAGYLALHAADGPAALDLHEREAPALVVLDLNLPRLDGFEVLRRLRQRGRTPVLVLTVRGSEEDLVRALDLGADDYLTKPFSPRTLLARIRALLRRAAEGMGAAAAVGDVVLDPEGRTVALAGAPPVRLTDLEYRLLQLLLANAGRPLPAERLLAHVWGDRGSGDRQLLKQLVHRLRQKLEADAAAPRYLVTVPGRGYALQPGGEPPA